MPFVYEIEHDEPLIKVSVTGAPDYLSTDRLWRDIAAACRQHQCFLILGQSDTDDWSADDAYDHAAVFEAAGIDDRHRIAWVEKNDVARESIKLAEAVVRHRGLNTGRAFDSVAEASQWLTESADTLF